MMSGRIARAFATASRPLSTVVISMSSLAKLIPTTFWIVTLSSASSRVLGMGPPGGGHNGPLPSFPSIDGRFTCIEWFFPALVQPRGGGRVKPSAQSSDGTTAHTPTPAPGEHGEPDSDEAQ